MGFFDGIGSSLVSGGLGFLGGTMANDAAHDMAADQFAWSLQADNTKYRRAVEDLRKAGLNPLLAVGGGIHGGTPSGGSTPGMHNPFEGISSALALKKQKAEIENIQENTQRTKAEAAVTRMEGIIRSNSAARAYWEEKFYQRHPELYTAEKIGNYANSVLAAGAKLGTAAAASTVAAKMKGPRALNTNNFYGPLNRLP